MKIRNTFSVIFYSMFCLILSGTPFSASAAETMQLTANPYSFFGYAVLLVFAAAYVLVFAEEHLGLRKSKPVLVAAGLIWILVSIAYAQNDNNAEAIKILRHNTLEYAELLFFLLAAMSYINSMVERGVFDVLRHKLVSSELSLRGLFWTTGVLAFFLSPIADNLTTAMVMGTVVISIGKNYKKFVTGACINIVIAANAGGAFSPFGDITTLMVWQKGVVSFGEFFALFIPSLINWLVPAFLISLTVEKKTPRIPEGFVEIKRGGRTICALFAATIITTVLLHHLLALPPFFGMMFGLGALKIYGYFLQLQEKRTG